MFRTTIKRAIALSAAIVMIITCGAMAEKAYVKTDTLVYAKPETTSKASITLEKGSIVNVTAEKGGWAQVKKGGAVGYIAAGDVDEITTYNGKTMYISSSAELYKTCGGSAVLMTLKKGDSVKLYATAGEWACIKADGEKGFVTKSVLAKAKPAKDEINVTAYAAEDGARVYKSNSTSSKVLCTLNVNETVSVKAAKGVWCKVERDGKAAYMKKTDLSTEKVIVPEKVDYTGYIKNSGVKEYAKAATDSQVIATHETNDTVQVTAQTDSWCMTSAGSYIEREYISTAKISTGDSSATPATGTAKAMDWWSSGIQSIFATGTVATITDVETGIAWQEKRMGGTNHADCQPLTSTDTASMKAACGGKWTWNRRAIFVTINGVNYAASMNCMPHGSDSISGNAFDGHHCIHFTNSRTHGTNKVDSAHQAAVKTAAEATLR